MDSLVLEIIHLSEATDAELQIGAAQIGIKGYDGELLHPTERCSLIKEIQRNHYFNIVVNMHSRVISPYQIVDIDNCVLV
jgi:hypothetical protein